MCPLSNKSFNGVIVKIDLTDLKSNEKQSPKKKWLRAKLNGQRLRIPIKILPHYTKCLWYVCQTFCCSTLSKQLLAVALQIDDDSERSYRLTKSIIQVATTSASGHCSIDFSNRSLLIHRSFVQNKK